MVLKITAKVNVKLDSIHKIAQRLVITSVIHVMDMLQIVIKIVRRDTLAMIVLKFVPLIVKHVRTVNLIVKAVEVDMVDQTAN